MTRYQLTSGLFPVLFPGNGTTLYLLVSSFKTPSATVSFRVNALEDDGSKSVLREGEFSVPGGQTERLAVEGVDGRTLEVELDLPSASLAPSLALVGTFAADGAESTLVWISPRGFVRRSLRFSRLSSSQLTSSQLSADPTPTPSEERPVAQTTSRTPITRNALRSSVVWRPPAPRRSQRFTRRDGRRHPQQGGSNHA